MTPDTRPDFVPVPDCQGIALIGYRGTGKSTVGRLLADRLRWPFADADRHVEARLGRAISDVFAQLGEPAFRDAEREAVLELTGRTPLVLATGGGAILHPDNRRALRDFGLVVWLQAPPEVLAERLRADRHQERPALTAAGLFDEIAGVLAAREPLYRDTCHLALDTTGLDPDRVAQAIHQHYTQHQVPSTSYQVPNA